MKKYAIVFEKGKRNWSAFSPDVLGCIACGGTFNKTERLMRQALKYHLALSIEYGDPVPDKVTPWLRLRRFLRKESRTKDGRAVVRGQIGFAGRSKVAWQAGKLGAMVVG